jgi:hypothetical protein
MLANLVIGVVMNQSAITYVVAGVTAALTVFALWQQIRGNKRQEQLTRAFKYTLEQLLTDSKALHTKEEVDELTRRIGDLEAQIEKLPMQTRRVFLEERRELLAVSMAELYSGYRSISNELDQLDVSGLSQLDESLRVAIEEEMVPQHVARQRQQRLAYTGVVIMLLLYLFPGLGGFVNRLLTGLLGGLPLSISTGEIVSYVGGCILFTFVASLIPDRRLRAFLPRRSLALMSAGMSLCGWLGLVGTILSHGHFAFLPLGALVLASAAWFIVVATYTTNVLGFWGSLCGSISLGLMASAVTFQPWLVRDFPQFAMPQSQINGLASIMSLVALSYMFRAGHYWLRGMRKRQP